MKFKDYYETLGVERGATQDEIKKAYRRLARKYHPDVSKLADTETRFKEVNEANEVLGDPEKRAAYDQMGRQYQAGPGLPAAAGLGRRIRVPRARRRQRRRPGFRYQRLLRGPVRPAGAPRRRPARAAGQAAGEDHHAKVLIDLEDAYTGARRSITLRMPVVDAQGRVALEERQLDVNIPKGIRAGQHLRLAGQGAPGFGGASAGDLFLEIGFNPHPRFRVDGRDVYADLALAPWEAALGATVDVPTPEGTVQLTVPPGSAAGRKLRLRGKGIPGKTPGDLYVVLAIALPPADTQPAKEAYAALAKAFENFNPRA